MMYFAKWKIGLIVGVCLIGFIFVLPNFFSRASLGSFPSFLPSQQISLGLDLQGGSHLLLEVDIGVVLKERLEGLVNESRGRLRGDARNRIRYSGLRREGNAIVVRILNPEDYDRARELFEEMGQPIFNTLLGTSARDLDIDFASDGFVTIKLTDEAIEEKTSSAIEQSIEIVRRRIDETGTREPTIQRQGSDRILVQLPGVQDPDRIKRLLGKTAKLTFRLVDVDTPPTRDPSKVPAGSELVPSDDEFDSEGRPRLLVIRKQVMVGGENLVDANPGYDSRTNEPVVNFRFDAVGGRRFGEVTSANVGRPFAIVLDGKVISAPVIRQAIIGGSGQISGGFTVQEANDLSILLRAGALPAPLKILEERTVGPDLGADSVAAGKIASVIAFLLVMVFMFAAYGMFGLIANLALVVNLVLIGGGLSALQATLTLPGIAGIVLTIGMAVDANVLIFERIKEEVRLGRTPIAAIEAGYKRALTTIIDSNVTTLIAAILLFQFGSGPVKGFAVTLAFGIASSMFTAIMLTRLVIATWIRKRKTTELPL
jgi:protein-export membrane protein SecD